MRVGKAVFVAIFFGLILLPGVQMVFHPISLGELEEKRRLEPPPAVWDILRGDGRLATAINRWFDDHVGFRPWLIRAKNQLDNTLFGFNEKVFIGTDGWLYLRTYFDTKIVDERRGEEGQRRIREGFMALANYVAQKGIKLVVVSNPIKETMVPEHQPFGVPYLPVHDQFEKLREFLKQERGWIYIDGPDVLRRPCTPLRTFQLIDLHMTSAGDTCFAREVVERIGIAEGRSPPVWHHHANYLHRFGSDGGLADFLGIFKWPSQPVDYPERYYGWRDTQADGDFAVWPGGPIPGGIYEWVWHAREPFRHTKLPPVVLFGNSFLDFYPFAGFASYFQDVYRGSPSAPKRLKQTLDQLPDGTRYFVYQFIEPGLGVLSSLGNELK